MSVPPEITRLVAEWEDALRRGDAAACAALYTEDGVIYLFSEPLRARGRGEIAAMHRAWIDTGEINQQFKVLEARLEETQGYFLAAWSGDFPQASGAYETFSGKVVTVLERNAGGPWQFHISSVNAGARAMPEQVELPSG